MRSRRGGARPCQCASQATRSSSRPRLLGGLVRVASRTATAALAAGCPAGRSRQSARSSGIEVKSGIGKRFLWRWTGRDGLSKAPVPPPQRPTERAMITFDEAWLKERAGELNASILFLTRLRYGPAATAGGAAIAQGAWAFPIAGLIVGAIGALVYWLAHRLGLPPLPCAALSVAATMLVTGCLHEDGLADTIDGFGGGGTREQKLDIMRDSRIGTYGVCALVLSVLLRASALANLSPALVVPALIAAHA